MGYDLHITRREYWFDEGDDISAAEWLEHVARDAELQLSPEQGPHFARWRGQCEYEEPWFDWDSGQIYTKNPDRAIVDKMLAMARDFGAKVQGDDGETYERGDQIDQPRPAPGLQVQYHGQRPLPRRQVVATLIAAALAIFGIYLVYFAHESWARGAGFALVLSGGLIGWLSERREAPASPGAEHQQSDSAGIVPGKYALSITGMRPGEFYRAGGIKYLIKGMLLKLADEEVTSGELMLPDVVERGICPEEEMNPRVMQHLWALEQNVDIGERLFFVSQGGGSFRDAAARIRGGGCYTLINPNTIGFYAYIYYPDGKAPGTLTEREVFSCMSFDGKREFSTSNGRFQYDDPPESESVNLKGQAVDAVIAHHLRRMAGMSLRTFSTQDHQAVIDAINWASACAARDKINRGLYRLVKAGLPGDATATEG